MSKPVTKCAIYTRKSSDEGLEQSFNSLDAQREACEAYIKSQKHEGWVASTVLYDDGGYSGGSMERPGLQKLMGDIQAGRVNVIVVYKVDRLTRSLADFAKMVELFDQHNVSFVSVTQQFNTTTSMGRLTLNVLLSFAQFEREVTGERIRDKIAASKAKGMWMGGVLPLGYAAKERTLVPIPEEAEKVRYIYKRYLALGNVRELEAELKRDKILSKIHLTKNDRTVGGKSIARGALYGMLKNPIYIGQIRHKGKCYDGQHEAIIPTDLWASVQKTMTDNRIEHKTKLRTTQSLLSGFVFDSKDEKLTPTNTVKDGKRYRYYVLASTTQIKSKEKLRLPAGEFENLVLDRLRIYIDENKSANRHELLQILNSDDRAVQRTAVVQIITKIVVYKDQVLVHLKNADLITIEYHFTARGQHMKLLDNEERGQASEAQKQAILKSYLQGVIWRRELFKSSNIIINDIAKKYGKSGPYVSRLINFSLMSPQLVNKFLKSDIPANIVLENMIYDWPIIWKSQSNYFYKF